MELQIDCTVFFSLSIYHPLSSCVLRSALLQRLVHFHDRFHFAELNISVNCVDKTILIQVEVMRTVNIVNDVVMSADPFFPVFIQRSSCLIFHNFSRFFPQRGKHARIYRTRRRRSKKGNRTETECASLECSEFFSRSRSVRCVWKEMQNKLLEFTLTAIFFVVLHRPYTHKKGIPK